MQRVLTQINIENYPESLRPLLLGADIYDSRCASVFNQIEEWGIAKSVAAHFASLYLVYVTCYLVNDWFPFEWVVIGIFTAVFAATYAIIWLTVYLIVRATAKKLNKKIA